MQHALFAISPVDGRYADKTAALRSIVSEHGLIYYRCLVEIRWLQFLAKQPDIAELPPLSAKANQFLEKLLTQFSEKDSEQIKRIEKTINHDVKAVEYFLKEQCKRCPELIKHIEFFHFACTSEDINNLAYGLMLREAAHQVILPHLDGIIAKLVQFAHQFANEPMLAHTHGQPATPTTVGKEFANFAYRLQRQQHQLHAAEVLGKFNGATGNLNALHVAYPNIDWRQMCQEFVEQLGLVYNPYTTQIEPHDYLAEIAHILIRINTILIDFCRDVWGYIALQYLQQNPVEHEVGSSTMPHKINPINFENAEGNLGVAISLLDHFALKLPISRWQRDLSDSTVFRNIGQALALCDIAYQSIEEGLKKVTINRPKLNQDLNDNVAVLAEAIQTVMRRYGQHAPYEKLKNLTRGKQIKLEDLHRFIDTLDLSDAEKQSLKALTPQNYIGIAATLAKNI